MAITDQILSTFPERVASNFSFILNLLQAVGLAIVVYIIFNLINFFFSRKREQELEKINKNLEAIKRLLSKQSKKRR